MMSERAMEPIIIMTRRRGAGGGECDKRRRGCEMMTMCGRDIGTWVRGDDHHDG